MTELIENAPTGPMSPEDEALAEEVYAAIMADAVHSERGEQAAEFRVGMSDLGYCSERTKRMLNHEVPEPTDMLLAWIGTVLGEGLEDALAKHMDTEVVTQAEVTTPLKGEHATYNVMGHPDIILPRRGVVLDGKTSYGLRLAERVGVDQQKQFQRHGYGYGAWLEGFFGDLPLEEVRVGNIWIDRSGKERRVHVQTEPFSDAVLEDAARWLDETVYAFKHKQEAQKEPPREVCFATCGFYDTCRGLETDVEGLIRDPWALEAIRMYRQGHETERSGKAMKDEAKASLIGVEGSDGEFSLRWVEVGEVKVEGFVRAPHRRIDLKPVKRGKR
jgi:hypothetical protein